MQATTTVGIRDLKAQLSQYMRQVKSGKTITITEWGKPIGRIIPIEESLEEKMETLVNTGFAVWSGERLTAVMPTIKAKGDKTIAQLVVEDRE